MGHKYEELKHRVEAKKKELQSKLETLKADSHEEAAAKSKTIREQLGYIETEIKVGWENITEAAASKLSEWLK